MDIFNNWDNLNSSNKDSSSEDDNLYNDEETLRNYDLKLASLENFGGAVTAIGYLLISLAGKRDYYNILFDTKSSPSPIQLLLNGQVLILIGYYLLWIVATNRALVHQMRDNHLAYSQRKIAASYLISIIANTLRLEGFLEIYNDENNI